MKSQIQKFLDEAPMTPDGFKVACKAEAEKYGLTRAEFDAFLGFFEDDPDSWTDEKIKADFAEIIRNRTEVYR